MVIYVVSLYTRCLRYNICCSWFLDIRISTFLCSDGQFLQAGHIISTFFIYFIKHLVLFDGFLLYRCQREHNLEVKV